MSPARFRWGIILIQLGILILLANLDVINYNFLFEAVVFLAVVLIMVGIEKIFTKSRLQIISYLTSIGIFVIGFLIVYNTSIGGREGSFWSETTYRKDLEPEVQKLQAVLDFDDIGLTIRDVGDDLIYGRFDEYTSKPEIVYSRTDSIAYVTMTKSRGGLLGGAITIDTDKPRDWYLRFSDSIPIDLECYGEDSDIHLNMSTSRLERLELDADESVIYLKLGDLHPRVNISVRGNDSSLKLRVPENVGLKIFGEDYSSYLTRLGLIEAEGGSFVNEGFDTLSTQIEVDLDSRLKSFILDYF